MRRNLHKKNYPLLNFKPNLGLIKFNVSLVWIKQNIFAQKVAKPNAVMFSRRVEVSLYKSEKEELDRMMEKGFI